MLTIPETPEAAHSDDASPAAYGLLFERAASINAEIGSVYAEWSKEHLSFLQKRGLEDIGFLSQLGSCKTPAELVQAYQAFLLKASQDRGDEYAALARIGKRALVGLSNQLPDATSA